MNCLVSLWHWYTTVDATGDIARSQETALIAIASVAAVLWTGGLIAFQLKGWSVSLGVGLDFASNAFMAALFALFVWPLTLRYVATFFFFAYVVLNGWVIYKNRGANVEIQKASYEKKHPELEEASVEDWARFMAQRRRYMTIQLCMLAPYLAVVCEPFQTVVSWFAALYTLASYQMILYAFITGPNAVDPWAMKSSTATVAWLVVIAQKLDALLKKP
jgi:hypothetical protein